LSIASKALAELVGTAVLVAVVVGSGLMGTQLSKDLGVALVINAASTVLVLALLIFVLGPVSGAHFNPAVSMVMLLRQSIDARTALAFIPAQIVGAVAGAILANLMFNLPAVTFASTERVSPGLWIGEVVATAGLVALILILVDRNEDRFIPIGVAAWIGSAYFFTSSTSFANPAVSIGRIFSDSFAGISPASVGPFIAAQIVGAFVGLATATALKNSVK
jgi:glycerol uptake facilitator-like aquaporin